jgi:creatinine amidohydrolase
MRAILPVLYKGCPMLLAFSTWQEIETRIARSKTVVVPIGSNEQHGPTGLLGTDWLCPEIISHAASRADPENILVAPTFNIGMAQHHLAFAGTITLRPSTFQAAIADWVSSLVRHGFERIIFLNGHGGNIASIEAAFSEVYSEWSFAEERTPFIIKLRNWWELPGVTKLCGSLYPGVHATPAEIAVTQAGYPDSIKTAPYEPKIAPSGPIRDALDYRARFPDGRIGSDPIQASPEDGQKIIDLAVPGLLAEVKAFGEEVIPGL